MPRALFLPPSWRKRKRLNEKGKMKIRNCSAASPIISQITAIDSDGVRVNVDRIVSTVWVFMHVSISHINEDKRIWFGWLIWHRRPTEQALFDFPSVLGECHFASASYPSRLFSNQPFQNANRFEGFGAQEILSIFGLKNSLIFDIDHSSCMSFSMCYPTSHSRTLPCV